MKRSFLKFAAVLLASVFMMTLAASAVSAAMAGPSAPSFSAVMRHTPKTLFPVPGTAVLTVTDAETGLPVAGAKYDLIRTSAYGGADSKIGTYVTDKDGKITVSHASTGTFCWAAAETVEGYAADTEKHAFTVIAAQFAETEIALVKPAPEPEPEDDGYVALNLEKAAALAAFIDENGIYTEGSVSNFYLLPAFYAVDDTRTMEVDLVHYPDEDKLVLVCGRALSENDSEDLLTIAILTLNNAADKYFTFTDENGVQYYMNINAPKFAFSLNPPATVWSENYLDMTAYKQDDDTEADSAIRDRMVVELKGLLLDFQGVTAYWDLDIGVDDIGFTMHDFGDDLSVIVLEDGSYIDLTEAAEELAG